MGWGEAMRSAGHLSRELGRKVYVRGYRHRHDGWRYGVYSSRAVAQLVSDKRGSGMSAMADDWRECAHA